VAEPALNDALQWWPQLTNAWTPVGWKNHLFRFNVLYTGVILAEPHPKSPFAKKHTQRWDGLGVQLTILPVTEGKDPRPKHPEPYQLTDGNANRIGRQGWRRDHSTPVLWTQWRQTDPSINSVVARQEIFAHIPEAADIETGVEPLFGWIRLSVEDLLEQIPRETVGFLLKINAPHI
jgi:hypothetical protein